MNKWIGMAVLCAGCAMAWAAPVVERVETDSTWVHDVSFEMEEGANEGTIRVQLGDDPVPVRYFEVPQSVWEEFKAAESKGAFYTANIRQRYERQYGKSRQEVFDSPIPVQTQVNALCAFNEECEGVVLQGIEKSQESIWIAAYAFTRTRIAAAPHARAQPSPVQPMPCRQHPRRQRKPQPRRPRSSWGARSARSPTAWCSTATAPRCW